MNNAIEIRKLKKKYDNNFELGEINLDIPSGYVIGLIGENGAGKTTLIKSILNIINTDTGEIKIFNKDNKKYDYLTKENVGAVLDDMFFPEILTANDINIIMKGIYKNWDEKLFYKYLDDFKLDKALLTNEEQNQILFSLQGINKLQIDANKTYDKLKNIFSKDEENWFEVDFSIWGKSDEHKQNFEIIKNAIINKNVIEFLYFNSYGKIAERKVEPLKLLFKYNSWYLVGFDEQKEDYRLFKIMRIKHLKTLENNFERKIPVSMKLDDKSLKTVKLVLEIDKELSYRVYDEFEESAIKKLDNGNFMISVEYPLNDWIYGYILSFKNHIKVLEPQMIRDEIKNILEKSLEKYN